MKLEREMKLTVNNKLVNGSIVTIRQFPGVKWLLSDSKYTYKGRDREGWHITSLDNKQVLPVTCDILNGMIVTTDTEYPRHGYMCDEKMHISPGLSDDILDIIDFRLGKYASIHQVHKVAKALKKEMEKIPQWEYF